MYREFYGLRENPFNVTSDPSFLYMSRAHKEAMTHLLYGIKKRKGFIEITGEIGAGKTTLCKAVLNQLEGSTRTAFILNSDLPEAQLLEAILEDLGITPGRRSKIAFLRQLNNFLLEEQKRGFNVALILDEAQNIKMPALETIRLLSNLETDKEKLVQIVIVGQPELKRKLNSPELLQLRQRIAVRFHITPLERDEIDKYIIHRLAVAGSVDDIVFTNDALEKLFTYTKGVPRLINLVCDKMLLSGFVLGRKFMDVKIAEQSIREIEGEIVEIGV
ncbi:ExeA family protein [Candidatus Omnitrophota bacterium]